MWLVDYYSYLILSNNSSVDKADSDGSKYNLVIAIIDNSIYSG